MAIPHVVRLFTCFVNGKNEIGKVTSVTLPKLTRKTENFRGGGMMGSVAIDLGLDDGALDATMVLGGVVREALLEYGGDMSHTALRFVGWLYDDEGGSQACEVEMRGRITEIDMGETKQGETTSHSFSLKNAYYKLSIDDKPLFEFDLLNFIYRKDGKDIVPDRIRSALGLG
ncbi:phage major tail tube protein [Edwardsiella tarda]|uniref:phage major tail tube protein n=1 Tax=Edwardsiella tarda TaxID=636 RepID=UPI00351C29DE